MKTPDPRVTETLRQYVITEGYDKLEQGVYALHRGDVNHGLALLQAGRLMLRDGGVDEVDIDNFTASVPPPLEPTP